MMNKIITLIYIIALQINIYTADFNKKVINGQVIDGIMPIVEVYPLKGSYTIYINYMKMTNHNEKYTWHNIAGDLPFAMALYNSKGECVKSTNNRIIEVFKNKHFRDVTEIPHNRIEYRNKPRLLNFNNTNTCYGGMINLEKYYSIKDTNYYILNVIPMLLKIDENGEVELVKFKEIKIHIP